MLCALLSRLLSDGATPNLCAEMCREFATSWPAEINMRMSCSLQVSKKLSECPKGPRPSTQNEDTHVLPMSCCSSLILKGIQIRKVKVLTLSDPGACLDVFPSPTLQVSFAGLHCLHGSFWRRASAVSSGGL